MFLLNTEKIIEKYGDLSKDSRGITLHVGDMVFYVNGIYMYYLRVHSIEGGTTLISKVHEMINVRTSKYTYMLVINYSFKDYLKYVSKVYQVACEKTGEEQDANGIQHLNYIQALYSNYYTNDKGSLSDVLGREIKAGDYVYYKSTVNHTWMPAIVISNNKVFNTNFSKEYVTFVVKMDKRRAVEEKERKSLYQYYKLLSTLSSVDNDKQRGNFFYYKGAYVLYLGKFNFSYEQRSSTQLKLTYEHDSTAEIWLYCAKELSLELVENLLNGKKEALKEYIALCLDKGLYKENCYEVGNYIERYKWLGIAFSSFYHFLAGNGAFLGNIKIPKNLSLNLDKRGSILYGYNFEFKFL